MGTAAGLSSAKALEQMRYILEDLSDHHELEPRMKGHVVSVKKRDVGRDLHPEPHRMGLGLFPEKDGEP